MKPEFLGVGAAEAISAGVSAARARRRLEASGGVPKARLMRRTGLEHPQPRKWETGLEAWWGDLYRGADPCLMIHGPSRPPERPRWQASAIDATRLPSATSALGRIVRHALSTDRCATCCRRTWVLSQSGHTFQL